MASKESSVIIIQNQFPRAYFYRAKEQSSSSPKITIPAINRDKDLRLSTHTTAVTITTASNFAQRQYFDQNSQRIDENNQNNHAVSSPQNSFKQYIKPSLPLLNISRKISLYSDSNCKSQRAAQNFITEYEDNIKQLIQPTLKHKWELPNPLLAKAKIFGIDSVKGRFEESSRVSSLPRRRKSPGESESSSSATFRMSQVKARFPPSVQWIGKETSLNKDFTEKRLAYQSTIREIDRQLSSLRRQRIK